MVRERGRGGERERREGWRGGKRREGEKKEMKGGEEMVGKKERIYECFFSVHAGHSTDLEINELCLQLKEFSQEEKETR